MKILLPINGRMNQDANPEYVQSAKGEVLERRNCRISTIGNALVNTSFMGMQSIGTTTGLGTVVGFTEDKKRNWGIYFLKDGTIGRIYAFSLDTGTIIKILDDPSSCDFFNFGKIQARVINDILVWTDNINPIRQINIVRALNYSNPTYYGDWKQTYQEITDLNTRFAIPTPTDSLTATWGVDPTLVSNNLYFKTWQFAILYKYKDYEQSVFSGFSPLYVHPSLVFYPSITEQLRSENYLSMSVPMGSKEVVSTILLARENQGLWYKVKEFKKSTATDAPVAYNFYDSAIREYVTADIANLLNQGVPLLAGNVETIKNRVIFGDVTTNLNHPDVSLSLSNNGTMIDYRVSGVTYTIGNVNVTTGDTPGSYPGKITIDASTLSVSNGDILFFGLKGDFQTGIDAINHANGFAAVYSFIFNATYLCVSSTLGDALDDLTAQINDGGRDLIYQVNVIHGNTTVAITDCVKVIATRLGNTIIINFGLTESTYTFDTQFGQNLSVNSTYCFTRFLTSPVDANTYIGGSGYDVGIQYYDGVGNTSGAEAVTSINIPYDEAVYDKNSPTSKYKINKINVSISGNPPSWAEKYRIVCSKSTSVAGEISFTSGFSYMVEYNGQLATAILMPKNTIYTFSEGDYVNIKVQSASQSLYGETGVRVLGQMSEITKLRTTIVIVGVDDSIVAGNFIIVDTTYVALRQGGAVISIYQPLKTQDSTSYVYFDATPLYDISGGLHSVTNLTLSGGDGWIVRDQYSYPTPKAVYQYEPGTNIYLLPEVVSFDPSFAENTQLGNSVTNYNLGKPTVSLIDFKQQRLQEIWTGGQIIANTQINQLRDFSTLIHVALSESDGIIMGLRIVGDVLKVVQGHHETSVYIGIEKITNADGSMQLIASSGFFGTINRMSQPYGSQHNESIATNERDIYYFDIDNGCIVRSAPNGSISISDYGMESYFKNKAQQIQDCIQSGTPYNVRAYFDGKYNKYVLIFDIPNYKEAIVFSEKDSMGNEGWFEFIDMTSGGNVPDMVGTVGQQSLSFVGGTLWLHDKTTVYNSIYGENKEVLLRSLINSSPSHEKCLRAIDLDVSEGLNTKITTPTTNNNIIGQETILYAASYKSVQGKFVSKVYQNIRTTVGNNLDQLYVGDDMIGNTIEIDLSLTTNNKVEIRNMTVAILPE